MVITKLPPPPPPPPKAATTCKSMYSLLAPFLLFLIVKPVRIAAGSRLDSIPWKKVEPIEKVYLVLVLLRRSWGLE